MMPDSSGNLTVVYQGLNCWNANCKDGATYTMEQTEGYSTGSLAPFIELAKEEHEVGSPDPSHLGGDPPSTHQPSKQTQGTQGEAASSLTTGSLLP